VHNNVSTAKGGGKGPSKLEGKGGTRDGLWETKKKNKLGGLEKRKVFWGEQGHTVSKRIKKKGQSQGEWVERRERPEASLKKIASRTKRASSKQKRPNKRKRRVEQT